MTGKKIVAGVSPDRAPSLDRMKRGSSSVDAFAPTMSGGLG